MAAHHPCTFARSHSNRTECGRGQWHGGEISGRGGTGVGGRCEGFCFSCWYCDGNSCGGCSCEGGTSAKLVPKRDQTPNTAGEGTLAHPAAATAVSCFGQSCAVVVTDGDRLVQQQESGGALRLLQPLRSIFKSRQTSSAAEKPCAKTAPPPPPLLDESVPSKRPALDGSQDFTTKLLPNDLSVRFKSLEGTEEEREESRSNKIRPLQAKPQDFY